MSLLAAAPIPIKSIGEKLLSAVSDFHEAAHAPFDAEYAQKVNARGRTAFGIFLEYHKSGLTNEFRTRIFSDLNVAIEKICANLSRPQGLQQKKQTIDVLGPFLMRKKLFEIFFENGAETVGKVIKDVEESGDLNKVFCWDTDARQFRPAC